MLVHIRVDSLFFFHPPRFRRREARIRETGGVSSTTVDYSHMYILDGDYEAGVESYHHGGGGGGHEQSYKVARDGDRHQVRTTVMRLARPHDSAVLAEIERRDGPLGDLEFVARAFSETGADGRYNAVFEPGEYQKMAVPGVPIYIEHCYPTRGRIPRGSEANPAKYHLPSERSRPIGRVVATYPDIVAGEFFVRGRYDVSGMSKREEDEFRDMASSRLKEMSIGYGVHRAPSALQGALFHGEVMRRCDGKHGRLFEISVTEKGDIGDSNILLVKASRRTTGREDYCTVGRHTEGTTADDHSSTNMEQNNTGANDQQHQATPNAGVTESTGEGGGGQQKSITTTPPPTATTTSPSSSSTATKGSDNTAKQQTSVPKTGEAEDRSSGRGSRDRSFITAKDNEDDEVVEEERRGGVRSPPPTPRQRSSERESRRGDEDEEEDEGRRGGKGGRDGGGDRNTRRTGERGGGTQQDSTLRDLMKEVQTLKDKIRDGELGSEAEDLARKTGVDKASALRMLKNPTAEDVRTLLRQVSAKNGSESGHQTVQESGHGGSGGQKPRTEETRGNSTMQQQQQRQGDNQRAGGLGETGKDSNLEMLRRAAGNSMTNSSSTSTSSGSGGKRELGGAGDSPTTKIRRTGDSSDNDVGRSRTDRPKTSEVRMRNFVDRLSDTGKDSRFAGSIYNVPEIQRQLLELKE